MHRVEPTRFRALLDSVLSVASGVDLPTALEQIVRSAVELTGAQYGVLGVLNETGTEFSYFASAGLDDTEKRQLRNLHRGEGIIEALIKGAQPIRINDMDKYLAPPECLELRSPLATFVGAPLLLQESVFGMMCLTNKQTGPEFSEGDQEIAGALAAAAAIAVNNMRLHAKVEDMAIVEERDRIARDLHDTVIQRLFATGLSLQIAEQRPAADLNKAVASAVNELDSIVREVRSAIFGLHEPTFAAGLRQTIRSVVAEASRALGFQVFTDIDDKLEQCGLTSNVEYSLVAAIRELLSNVVRHADATAAALSVTIQDNELILVLLDNGKGFDLSEPLRISGGQGLNNLSRRAQELGGSFRIENREISGMKAEWRVHFAEQDIDLTDKVVARA